MQCRGGHDDAMQAGWGTPTEESRNSRSEAEETQSRCRAGCTSRAYLDKVAMGGRVGRQGSKAAEEMTAVWLQATADSQAIRVNLVLVFSACV